MGVERRQGTAYQLSLLEWGEETVRPGVPGEGGTGTGANEEQQGPRRLNGNEPCRKP